MSDYVNAKDALDNLHREVITSTEERDALLSVVKRIGSEATDWSRDARVTLDVITRLVNQTIETNEARRGAAAAK